MPYIYMPCIYIHMPNTRITGTIYTPCWASNRRPLTVKGTGGACYHAGFILLINNNKYC